MRPTVLEFERTLSDLGRMLTRSSIEEDLLALIPTLGGDDAVGEVLKRFKQSVEPFALRRAQYAMQLVTLYGAFERLIEGLVIDCLMTLNEIVPTFQGLPQRVRENHRRKSLDALRDDVWLSRRSDPLVSEKLIECLHLCEARAANYRLNAVAYARHSGNFRRKSIDELFREVGVDSFLGEVVAFTQAFRAYLDKETRERGMLDAELGAIDDLAERRNEIAHGDPASLLSRQEIANYIEFLRAFSHAAYEVLCRFLSGFLVGHCGILVGKIDKVHYRSVACFDLSVLREGTSLEVGDPVALELGARGGFRLGLIENIRGEEGDVEKLRSAKGIEACVQASMRLQPGRRLYLVDRNCSAAWLAKPLSSV